VIDNESCGMDDRDVIHRVLSGDVNAFELLVERYKAHVFKIVLGHVPREKAEEVAQDAFARSFESLSNFSGKGSFSHWLARIAVRCCYDFWRDHHRREETALSVITEDHQRWLDDMLAAQSREEFEREAAKAEAREILQYALGQLSAEDRMVLTLVYLEGASIGEASDLLGWSVVSVKVRAFRAKRRLRAIISEMLKGEWN